MISILSGGVVGLLMLIAGALRVNFYASWGLGAVLMFAGARLGRDSYLSGNPPWLYRLALGYVAPLITPLVPYAIGRACAAIFS